MRVVRGDVREGEAAVGIARPCPGCGFDHDSLGVYGVLADIGLGQFQKTAAPLQPAGGNFDEGCDMLTRAKAAQNGFGHPAFGLLPIAGVQGVADLQLGRSGGGAEQQPRYQESRPDDCHTLSSHTSHSSVETAERRNYSRRASGEQSVKAVRGSDALDDNHLGLGGTLPQGLGFAVFVGVPPRLGLGDALKLQHHDAVGLPVALQIFGLCRRAQ